MQCLGGFNYRRPPLGRKRSERERERERVGGSLSPLGTKGSDGQPSSS